MGLGCHCMYTNYTGAARHALGVIFSITSLTCICHNQLSVIQTLFAIGTTLHNIFSNRFYFCYHRDLPIDGYVWIKITSFLFSRINSFNCDKLFIGWILIGFCDCWCQNINTIDYWSIICLHLHSVYLQLVQSFHLLSAVFASWSLEEDPSIFQVCLPSACVSSSVAESTKVPQMIYVCIQH